MSKENNTSEQVNQVSDSLVLQYVEAAALAGDRVRTVIIVMLVASVFVFTQIMNADGWWDRRIETRVYALRLLDSNFDEKADILSKDPQAQEKETVIYQRARHFINNSGYKVNDKNDQDRLKDQIKELTKLRDQELRLVRLPFFGAAFDANDMGIFAGITFTVVLLWLALTIKREHRNIQIAFGIAKTKESFQLCYNLLAMRQVISVPPTLANRLSRPLGYMFKVLYLMPLLIYVCLFYHDWDTRSTGHGLGWDKMNRLLWVSGICLFFILILTIICFAIIYKKDKDWVEYTKKVRELIQTQ
jgi:hypothetical protein